jgi:hypothetical protein
MDNHLPLIAELTEEHMSDHSEATAEARSKQLKYSVKFENDQEPNRNFELKATKDNVLT